MITVQTNICLVVALAGIKICHILVYFVEQDIIYLALLCGVYIMHLSTHTYVMVTLYGEMRRQQD